MIEPREIEHVLDIRLLGAVEHRRRDRHAVPQVVAELDEAVLVERLDGLLVAVDLLERLLERLEILPRVVGVSRLADAVAEAGAGPTEMGLEDLTDVHTARHAE